MHNLVSTSLRRLLLATVLWVLFWPTLRFIQLGDITGPHAFFWITGIMNYPVTAVIFSFADGLLDRFKLNPWIVFLTSALIASATVPLYYQRVGGTFGVFVDAFLF